MGFFIDPNADKRSLMHAQPRLCNGQKTGRACVHYWAHNEPVESANSDVLRLGQLFRVCGVHPSIAHEMESHQLATHCNRYAPRRLPLYKRPLRWLRIIDDPGAYNPSVEEYRPLTPEEVKAIRDAFKADTPEDAHARDLSELIAEYGAAGDSDAAARARRELIAEHHGLGAFSAQGESRSLLTLEEVAAIKAELDVRDFKGDDVARAKYQSELGADVLAGKLVPSEGRLRKRMTTEEAIAALGSDGDEGIFSK